MLHTLVALVEDKPDVLNRVASLFRRRAFNIEAAKSDTPAKPAKPKRTPKPAGRKPAAKPRAKSARR